MRHVVVVGGGFAGLGVVRALAKEPVYVTLVDRQNHHLFQPLLYQVAMAGLSPAEVATPTRSLLRSQDNARVLMGEVTEIDVARREIGLAAGARVPYDYLVLAAGAVTNYRGQDRFARHALGLKDLEEAIEIRQRVLLAFEAAEREQDERRRQRLLTFVVVGAGPTGVELAGALAELARFVLARDFRHIQPGATRVVLVEGGPRVLPSFSEEMSIAAERQLLDLGVDVRKNARIEDIGERGVVLGGGEIASATVIWAAGVKASPLAAMVGAPVDRTGRVLVAPDCSLPGRSEVFVIGDMAHFATRTGPLPGIAPVAVQQGRAVARSIRADLRGSPRTPFSYRSRGAMATIGRSRAVAEHGRLRVSGMLAWLSWLVVHVFFLVGFRNRLVVLLDWLWSYVTYGRGSRLIAGRTPRRVVPDLATVLATAPEEDRSGTLRLVAPLAAVAPPAPARLRAPMRARG